MSSLETAGGGIRLSNRGSARPLEEVVLFGFDDTALPFRDGVAHHLIPGDNPEMVLAAGPDGSPDEVLLYYGTVIRIGEKFHMWYVGSHGPPGSRIGYGHGRERQEDGVFTNRLCYAVSADGVRWEKPELGLAEFRGSKKNNLVDLPEPAFRPAAVVFFSPDDPDAERRFKLAYEAERDGIASFCVAFSPDGFNWELSDNNPVAGFFEMSGGVVWNGLYHVAGQAGLRANTHLPLRTLDTYVSADFENWSPCPATGLSRSEDLHGPSADADIHRFEEIHLGAGLWDRGNVIVGIYGQWHGHPSGDRRLLTMDLGLALSHDALSYREPIRGFPFIPAREQPFSPSDFPALMQGQGMEWRTWAIEPCIGTLFGAALRERVSAWCPGNATGWGTCSLSEPGADAWCRAPLKLPAGRRRCVSTSPDWASTAACGWISSMTVFNPSRDSAEPTQRGYPRMVSACPSGGTAAGLLEAKSEKRGWIYDLTASGRRMPGCMPSI